MRVDQIICIQHPGSHQYTKQHFRYGNVEPRSNLCTVKSEAPVASGYIFLHVEFEAEANREPLSHLRVCGAEHTASADYVERVSVYNPRQDLKIFNIELSVNNLQACYCIMEIKMLLCINSKSCLSVKIKPESVLIS